MNRIDRYVSGYFWAYFLGGLVVFVTLICAVDAMSNMVEFPGTPGSVFLRYYGYYLPEYVYRMIPVACLLATILTLSTLQKGNELVALFSVGMSLFRISLPMIFWVLLNCGLVLLLSDQIMPQFAKEKNFIYYHDIKKTPSLYSTVKTDRIWYRSKDMIFNIKILNERAQKAQGLSLYFFNSKWDLVQMITAQEVDLLGTQWLLKNGSVTIFSEDSSFPLTSKFQTKTIVMGEDSKDLSSTANTSDILSLRELSSYIAKNKEAGLDTVRYEVDYQSKYGFALAGFVMTLLGIPFSVGRARSGGIMLNVGICMGLVAVYWIIYSSALTLGNHGEIPPLLAAWMPNLTFSGLALFSLWRLRR
jgi:lipopolysaccharide export system permease protein